MKFTFDGNIYENNNSSQDLKSDQKIILSGLIFESNTRLAALPFESEVRSFMSMDAIARSRFVVDVLAKKTESERAAFLDTFAKLSPSKTPSDPSDKSETENKKSDSILPFS